MCRKKLLALLLAAFTVFSFAGSQAFASSASTKENIEVARLYLNVNFNAFGVGYGYYPYYSPYYCYPYPPCAYPYPCCPQPYWVW